MEDLTRREDPSAGIVRIMTIHKSKGLGFDIVILPQIGRDTSFADGRHLTHFIKNGEGGVEGIVLAPPRHVYMNIPQFRELYGEWRARQQFDGFCKLYVALTRAKRATYVILPYREDKEETEADSMWKVVRSSIRPLNRGTEDILPESGASCLYSRGLDGWYEEFPESIQKRAEKTRWNGLRKTVGQRTDIPFRPVGGSLPAPGRKTRRRRESRRAWFRRPCRV